VRFLMVDRVLSLEPGKRIEAVKCVSLTEEYLRGHFARRPLVPGALLVEMVAQTLGRLINATYDFRYAIVLAGLDEVRVAHDLEPGRVVTVVGALDSTNPRGSVGHATATSDGREVCSVGRVLYGQMPHPDPEGLRARFRALGGGP
jgi:3-hydroxyacyl-[acyl-carrier-protein] dehydratase